MSAGSQRAALDAVHAARPIVARLDRARDKEDIAADIIEAWAAVESGLRSLIGGSSLTGQMLIRELRQRHFLTLEQANALAEFHAARDRAGRVDYLPTEADVEVTRDAFLKLEAGLMGAPAAGTTSTVAAPSASATYTSMPVGGTPAPRATPVPAQSAPTTDQGFSGASFVAAPGARPGWLFPLLGALGLLAVCALVWFALAGRTSKSTAFDEGVTAYRERRPEAALGAFRKATLDAPADPMPHVYLARIERENNNLVSANGEAVKAVQLGPTNGAALRELASTLFAQRKYDNARTFYIRAVQADSSDRLSKGFLGCSLIRLGRIDEGVRMIQRAGEGVWTSCVPAPGSTGAGGPSGGTGVGAAVRAGMVGQASPYATQPAYQQPPVRGAPRP